MAAAGTGSRCHNLQASGLRELLLNHPDGDRAQDRVAAMNEAAQERLEGQPRPASRPWSRVSAGAAGQAGIACKDDRTVTTVLVNCAGIMEQVDEQLLPALYRFVGKSFQASPAQLGVLTLSRALVQALASPLAGVLGHHGDRIVILSVGVVLWGTMTAMFSSCNSVKEGMPFWAINGIGLSFLIPTSQSLIADYNTPINRGKAFGLLQFTSTTGAFIGTMYATNLGNTKPFGLEGWRFVFLTVAAASWLIGVLTWLVAVDPRHTSDERYRIEKCPEMSVRTTVREIQQILSIPSFRFIVSQGIIGTLPWNALVFLTFYFQLLGMSDFQASVLLAVFLVSSAAGSLLGGYLGDWAASRWPNHGRILLSQLSVAAGVPLSLLLFKGLPMSLDKRAMIAYISVLAAIGLTITWATTACNNPILSEICPVPLRSLIYSFDQAFEGAIGACGAPLVGWLAERVFGFDGAAETTGDVQDNLRRAHALGSALLIFTALPWLLCAIFYLGMHWTYPRDKKWQGLGLFGPSSEQEDGVPH